MAKKDVTTIDLGHVRDFIPMIREEVGDRCPSDDVLCDVLMCYTEKLMNRMNKAITLRYVDEARKYNPSLPTAQECFDQMKGEYDDMKHPTWNFAVEQHIRKKLTEEYVQANNLICFASRADHPLTKV